MSGELSRRPRRRGSTEPAVGPPNTLRARCRVGVHHEPRRPMAVRPCGIRDFSRAPRPGPMCRSRAVTHSIDSQLRVLVAHFRFASQADQWRPIVPLDNISASPPLQQEPLRGWHQLQCAARFDPEPFPLSEGNDHATLLVDLYLLHRAGTGTRARRAGVDLSSGNHSMADRVLARNVRVRRCSGVRWFAVPAQYAAA